MELNELITRIFELRQEIKVLKEKEALIAKQIHAIAPSPYARDVDGIMLAIGEPRPFPVILDADLVPSDFKHSVPDKNRIKGYFLETGEYVPGCEVEIRPGILRVKALTRTERPSQTPWQDTYAEEVRSSFTWSKS